MLKKSDVVKSLTSNEASERIDVFLNSLLEDKSAATIKTYSRALSIFVLWLDDQGERTVLSQGNLERYPVYLRRERKVTPGTVQTYLVALRQFFLFLWNQGLLEEDLTKTLKVEVDPSESSRSRGILTEQEIKRVFEVSKGDEPIQLRDRAILCCMLIEGLSEREVSRSNYRDLELTFMGEELNIRGKARRIVPLDQRTHRNLRAYLRTRGGPIPPKAPLFLSLGPRELDERLKVRTVRSRMRLLLDRASITRSEVSPQSLSHTSILLQIQKGISRDKLKERTRPWRLVHRLIDLKERGLIDPDY